MSIIERIEAHLSTQPRIASIGYVLLHESLDELKARQWIYIGDKLPEKKGDYYVILKHGDGKPFHYISWYNKITWSAANVTHWMPLPEAPK